jgi:lipopolysaccharide assembly protein A
MILFMIIGVVLGIVSVIFALQNTALITVTFLAWELKDKPLAIVLLLALLSGIIVSLLMLIPELIRSRFNLRSAKKELEDMKAKLSSYKALVGSANKQSAERTVNTTDVDGNTVSFLE